MKHLFLPVALVLMPFFIMAQYTFSGKVLNQKTSEVLPGAHIVLLNSLQTAISSITGTFEINNLKTGSYSMVVSYVGFKTDTIYIELTKNTASTISLMPAAIMQDEVIVRATRAGNNTPVAHQDIDKKEISAVNFGQDLPLLIGNSVSAVATSDAGNGMGYTSLRIRGTDITRINVTINGIPLNDPESHNVYWVDLPDIATSTDNIQIQRGVGTSTNGASAFGASINLQTVHLKTEPYAEAHSAFGSFNTLKNTAIFGTGIIDKHFTFDGRISQLSSDGFIDRASADLSSYYLSGAYVTSRNLLRFNFFSGKEKTYQAWYGIPSSMLSTDRTYNPAGSYFDKEESEQFYDNETDNYSQTHYQAQFSHEFSNSLFFNASIHHTKGAGYYEQYKEDARLKNYGIEPVFTNSPFLLIGNDTIFTPDNVVRISDLIRQKHLENDFTGITWSLNHQLKRIQSSFGGSWNTYDGNHFGRVIWAQFSGASQIYHEWYRSKGLKKDFNIFVKSEYAVKEDLFVWADFQYRSINYSIEGIDDDLREITQEHTFDFVNPKAGISYKLSDRQGLYLSFSIANREPNRDNFVDADPTKPVPRAETLYDAEAGYSVNSSRFSLNSNIFTMYYHNQLVLTGAINDVGESVMVNVPYSYRTGIELSANLLILTNLKWESSITLSRNKIKHFSENIPNWDDEEEQIIVNHTQTDLAFSPAIIANSNLKWTAFKGFNIGMTSKYVGKQYIDNTQSNDRKLEAYLVNNLLISYAIRPKFVREINFSLIINNLLNKKYESNAWVSRYFYGNEFQKFDGYFPQAGIHYMVGAKVDF